MDKLLYRPDEVAELCSVSRSTVYEAMKTGALRFVKIGASRRIPREAIGEYLSSLAAA
ncbi:MAG: helix-turn-helix domain-containing protein [Dehalococcoidia bacterium]